MFVWVRFPSPVPKIFLDFMIKNIDKEHFIDVCNSSQSMCAACAQLGMQFGTFKRYALKFGCYKTNQSGKGIHRKSPKHTIPLNEILEGLHPSYQTSKLRKRLIDNGIKENKCECCGISSWNDKPLSIELHHIDGNRTNHKLENLMFLCPNCHSQTDTFRAKNINK